MINDVPTILSPSVNHEKARDEILNSPIYKDLIISKDARTTALQINIKNNQNLDNLILERTALADKEMLGNINSNEKELLSGLRKEYEIVKTKHDAAVHTMLKDIRNIKRSYENGHGLDLRLGGVPMIADDMIS